MSTQNYKTIIVVGTMYDKGRPARRFAVKARCSDSVPQCALTPSGHNCVASFAIFPTGSSAGREGAKSHAINLYLKWLASTSLEYVAVEWGDHVDHPRFLAASDPIPEIPSATEAAERSPEPAQTTPAKDSG